MAFESSYDSEDDIPSEVRHLFVQEGEAFTLIPQAQLKTVDDVNRVQTALQKERSDRKALKDRYGVLGDRDPNELLSALDEIEELRAAADGKLDDDKINEIADRRVRGKLAPVERERDTMRSQLEELQAELQQRDARENQRLVKEALREAAISAKVPTESIDVIVKLGERDHMRDEDGNVVTADGADIGAGMQPQVWLTELRNKVPSLFGETRGVGSRNGTGTGGARNPWTKDAWNATEQGRVFREDPNRAEQMARAAGTVVGGGRPKAS